MYCKYLGLFTVFKLVTSVCSTLFFTCTTYTKRYNKTERTCPNSRLGLLESCLCSYDQTKPSFTRTICFKSAHLVVFIQLLINL